MSQACPGCGTAYLAGTARCEYCGRALTVAPPAIPGEFGLRHGAWPLLGLLLAGGLYLGGWWLEDTRYWLDDRAIAVWAVALPIWLLLVALFWQPRWGGWLSGFLIGIVVLVAHAVTMWVLEDFHFQDDHAGIAAMFAGAASGGWLLGRLLHFIIRQARG